MMPLAAHWFSLYWLLHFILVLCIWFMIAGIVVFAVILLVAAFSFLIGV